MWSLWAGGLYIQLVFRAGSTVYTAGIIALAWVNNLLIELELTRTIYTFFFLNVVQNLFFFFKYKHSALPWIVTTLPTRTIHFNMSV